MAKQERQQQPASARAGDMRDAYGGAGSGEGQGEYGGDGYSAQSDFAGGSADPNADLSEEERCAVAQARQGNPRLGLQHREEAPIPDPDR